jgi:hypothetical protein
LDLLPPQDAAGLPRTPTGAQADTGPGKRSIAGQRLSALILELIDRFVITRLGLGGGLRHVLALGLEEGDRRSK